MRLPHAALLLSFSLMLCQCNNKAKEPAASKTSPTAPAVKKKPAQKQKALPAPEKSPSPDDDALTTLLEEAIKKSDYASIGPVTAADASSQFAAVRKSALEGPGLCYVVLAACKGDMRKIRVRVVDPAGAVVPSRPQDVSAADPPQITGILACPEKDAVYSVELACESGSVRCAVALLGN